ncbi:MAG: TIGR03986 family CRISPR-associated RAMP protein [Caldilineaceae bacterium]
MSRPRQSNPSNSKRTARAPYNFVPLPDQVVYAESDAKGLPSHDRYHADRLSGQIQCTLVTRSPLYTRRAVSPEWWQKWSNEMDRLHLDDKAVREYAEFFYLDQLDQPLIPGSSLRGMVRSVMEIVANGHLRWVGAATPLSFRAVAAPGSDPLREPYDSVIGRLAKYVRAGYLVRNSKTGSWAIQPAMTLRDMNKGNDQSGYLRIKEIEIDASRIVGFRPFDDPDYHPGFFVVRYDLQSSTKGFHAVHLRTYVDVDKERPYAGVLVCTGNMKETGSTKASPRRRHALVLAPTSEDKVASIPIRPETIEEYRATLTEFQREQLGAWSKDGELGCLGDGKPVFYVSIRVPDKNGRNSEQVLYFGHTPNFRIPMRLNVSGEQRACTPLDFVPSEIRKIDDPPDLVEALFGWVEEPNQPLKGQRSGRLSFSDARFLRNKEGLWLQSAPETLHTLSTPKPTTFQHYLVQDRSYHHDPDRSVSLAHYGTPPHETEIRGYKRYWHKGDNPDLAANDRERQHPDQLTRVRPLKAGVEFAFTIRFENLSSVELGALLWVLSLPGGDPNKRYYHKLGMGKPLGMGAIEIHPSLFLDQRQERYRKLFAGSQWHQASQESSVELHLQAFEAYLGEKLAFRGALADQPRIKTLLALLEWREGNAEWLDHTRYMEIERGINEKDEYDERPVLPDTLSVAKKYNESVTNAKAIHQE